MTLEDIAELYWTLHCQSVDAGNTQRAESYLNRFEEVCEVILKETRRELA